MLLCCPDVDECESDDDLCDPETEVCSNLIGTYVCKCGEELVRGDNGVCVTEEVREQQREAMKEKKKKRRKKKNKINKGNSVAEERRHYPWYFTLGPLVVTGLICKYWRPNLVTAMGIILFICVSATLAPTGSALS